MTIPDLSKPEAVPLRPYPRMRHPRQNCHPEKIVILTRIVILSGGVASRSEATRSRRTSTLPRSAHAHRQLNSSHRKTTVDQSIEVLRLRWPICEANRPTPLRMTLRLQPPVFDPRHVQFGLDLIPLPNLVLLLDTSPSGPPATCNHYYWRASL